MCTLKTVRLNTLVGLTDDFSKRYCFHGPLLSKAEKYYIEDGVWVRAKIEKYNRSLGS